LTTAREALLAEALGQVATLLDRLEAIAPVLESSREAIARSGATAEAQLSSFEARMTAIAERAQSVAVRHVAQRTQAHARSCATAQTLAMQDAARAMFRSELVPALQRLVAPLQSLARSGACPFERLLAHAMTAAVASALTWVMAAWLWAR
jgi:hypothetical protein